jgi:methanogenic corrinoid protein MtbC1
MSIPLSDAAERLGVHYMTAYRYVRLGMLAATQQQGRWVVTEDELASFEERRRDRPSVGRRRRGEPRSVDRLAALLKARFVAGDEPGAWRLAEEAMARGAHVQEVYLGGVSAALQSIGDDWAAGKLSIAQEHEASRVASRLIARLGARGVRRGRRRGTAVVAAPAGERHDLPTAIVADLLRLEGFHVVDLGADTPAVEVVAAVGGHDRVVGVGVCITTPLDEERHGFMAAELVGIREAVSCPLVIGGAAVPTRSHAVALGVEHWTADASSAVDWFVRRLDASIRPDDGRADP